MGVPEYVDAVQGGTVAGDPRLEVFILEDPLFSGKVEVYGVFDPYGVCNRNQERVDGPGDYRDRLFNADGVVKVQGVHLDDDFRVRDLIPAATANAEKPGNSQQEHKHHPGDFCIQFYQVAGSHCCASL